LRIPDAVIFALEQALELAHARESVFLLAHALWAAEVIRERQEVRPVAKMAEASAVAIGRGDRRGPERAAAIAALEGEHQAAAIAGVANQLERVLDGLRSADIEMHAALAAELRLGVARDHCGEFDLLTVQVLACHLR